VRQRDDAQYPAASGNQRDPEAHTASLSISLIDRMEACEPNRFVIKNVSSSDWFRGVPVDGADAADTSVEALAQAAGCYVTFLGSPQE
jgi:hypothetical protein